MFGCLATKILRSNASVQILHGNCTIQLPSTRPSYHANDDMLICRGNFIL